MRSEPKSRLIESQNEDKEIWDKVFKNRPGKIYLWKTLKNLKEKLSFPLKPVSAIFYQIFFSPPNDWPWETMKKVFYFIENKNFLFVLEIFNFLYFHLPFFFFPVSHCFRGWSKKNLKIYVINCLNQNLVAHFVWYLEKEIRCDIETLSIDRDLNKEHFYGKIMQKMCTKS